MRAPHQQSDVLGNHIRACGNEIDLSKNVVGNPASCAAELQRCAGSHIMNDLQHGRAFIVAARIEYVDSGKFITCLRDGKTGHHHRK